MSLRSARLALVLPTCALVGFVALTACTGDSAETPPGTNIPDGGGDSSTSSDAATAVPPSAPTAVIAKVDLAKGARVSWTPPASPGSSPIESYTLKASPGDLTLTMKGAVTSATILGLTPGTPYTFTVLATNDAGDGPPSAPSAAVTAVDGLTPTALAACSGTGKSTLDAPAVTGAVSMNVYFGTAPGVTRANGTKIANVTFPYAHTTGTPDAKLHYVFTAVDAAGIESVESNEIAATNSTGLADVAFATSYSSAKITIFDCFSHIADGTAATRTVTGALTQIAPSEYGNIFVDGKARRIYTAWQDRVTIWDNADTVNGNVAPSRTLTGASTGLGSGGAGIVVDKKRDRLYVVVGGNSIRVWANASTVTGDVAPTATISGANTTFGTNLLQLAFDEDGDRLYISNSPATTASIVVFDNASTLTGAQNIAPSRAISVTDWSTRGVSVDPVNNLLYVGSREGSGAIYTIANASTASGVVTPLHKFGTTASQIMTVQAVGSDVIAFADSATKFLVWSNGKDVDGNTAPTRSIGNDTTNGSGFFVVP